MTLMSVIWNNVMERFNKYNKTVQSVQIDLGSVAEIYSSLIQFIWEIRNYIFKWDIHISEMGLLHYVRMKITALRS